MPPSLKKSEPAPLWATSRQSVQFVSKHETNLDDDSTDDEDLDHAPKPSQSIHTHSAERTRSPHFRKTRPELHVSSEPKSHTINLKSSRTLGEQHIKSVESDNTTSNTASITAGVSEHETVPVSQTPPAPRSKGKLGVVGRHNKAAEVVPRTSLTTPAETTHYLNSKMNDTQDAVADINQNSVMSPELPIIDSQVYFGDTSRASHEDATQHTDPPPLPLELSQERADRRREELKRQLEAKPQAPVKRKRRF